MRRTGKHTDTTYSTIILTITRVGSFIVTKSKFKSLYEQNKVSDFDINHCFESDIFLLNQLTQLTKPV